MSKEESDFQNMIAVFDHALNSDDPQVKQALNTLVMIVALTRDPYGDTDGPFRYMWRTTEDSRREVQELQRMVERLMRDIDMLKTYPARDKDRWTRWPDIRGTSVDQVWIDEASIVPGAAWENVIKKVMKK
jgi:hypothetical protein